MNDFSQEEESYGWQALLHRFLKEKKDDGRMDYSALSVAVMTLGLIMVVEVLRHRLDHAAMGKPYFVAVLENIYAECKHAQPFERLKYDIPMTLHSNQRSFFLYQ